MSNLGRGLIPFKVDPWMNRTLGVMWCSCDHPKEYLDDTQANSIDRFNGDLRVGDSMDLAVTANDSYNLMVLRYRRVCDKTVC